MTSSRDAGGGRTRRYRVGVRFTVEQNPGDEPMTSEQYAVRRLIGLEIKAESHEEAMSYADLIRRTIERGAG